MPVAHYFAYRRWLDKWLPHLLYGSAVNSGGHAGRGVERPLVVTDLPGGSIVKAF